uniref:RRM domain-containing protein n=1 Tax=Romanomermis culicivorax TaxID=13658 RepID=A0A915L682_ROMCU
MPIVFEHIGYFDLGDGRRSTTRYYNVSPFCLTNSRPYEFLHFNNIRPSFNFFISITNKGWRWPRRNFSDAGLGLGYSSCARQRNFGVAAAIRKNSLNSNNNNNNINRMSQIAAGTPDTSRNSSTLSCASITTSNGALSSVCVANTIPPNATLTSVVSTPRVGVEFKDRIFVGGFPPGTTDMELRNFFSKFGSVREAKIIRDHMGTSKGYGFITYETEEEARRVRDSCGGFVNGENPDELLDFKGRKLNVGPAIRKASNKTQNLDVIPQGAVLLASNGTPFIVQNGITLCATPDAYTVAHPTIGNSIPVFLPHQFVLAAPPAQYVMPSASMQQHPAIQSAPVNAASCPMIQAQDSCANQHFAQNQNYSTSGQIMSALNSQMKAIELSSQSVGSSSRIMSANDYCSNLRAAAYNYQYENLDGTTYVQQGMPNAGGAVHVQHGNVLTPPPTPITMQYK